MNLRIVYHRTLKRAILLLFFFILYDFTNFLRTAAPSSSSSSSSASSSFFPPDSSTSHDNDDKFNRERVKRMAKRCWQGYHQYSWGDDELKPVSKLGRNWTDVSYLFTPIDSLDTLLIMGLTEEYLQTKELVLSRLDLDAPNTKEHNHFEFVIRVLGGILSAFTLDPDQRYLDLAVKIGDRLLVAFDHSSGFPPQQIQINTGKGGGESTCLAAIGTLQLEFQYLTDLTGDKKYQDKALQLYPLLEKLNQGSDAIPGLYPSRVALKSPPEFIRATSFRIGYDVDSFYEYLLKMYVSTKEEYFGGLYDKSRDALVKYLKVKNGNMVYLADYESSSQRNTNQFEHLACFSGAMFSLGAYSRKNDSLSADHFQLGQDITQTCQESYRQSETGLGGDIFTFQYDGRISIKNNQVFLRPEVIESVFYQYRLTGNESYRKFGVFMLDHLDQYAKTDTCYSSITLNGKIDNLESFFMAETLKYLYLLFSDSSLISLDEYVFNTEAHPFSIRGHGVRKDSTKWVPISSISLA